MDPGSWLEFPPTLADGFFTSLQHSGPCKPWKGCHRRKCQELQLRKLPHGKACCKTWVNRGLAQMLPGRSVTHQRVCRPTSGQAHNLSCYAPTPQDV